MTNQTKNLINEKVVSVRWNDMDTYAHLNNAKYFEYCIETLIDTFMKPFLPTQIEAFYAVDVQCDFKKPIQYPEIVTIKQYAEQSGDHSFLLSYELLNEKQELCAAGKATIAVVAKDTGKPLAIPSYIQKILGDNLPTKYAPEPFVLDKTKLLNTLVINSRWVDNDAFHHVNSTRYFDFMVETRNALFPHADIRNDLCLFFLMNTRCIFYKSFRHPAQIKINQYLLHVGASSFSFGYQFFSGDDPKIYAEGSATLVCVDKETHRPIKVAAQVLKIMEGK